MRLLVFGAGAVGSVVAARLSTRHDVSIVGRRQHIEAIRERGLRLRGATECTVPADAIDAFTSAGELSTNEAPEMVLLTVKSYDTKRAVSELEMLWTRSVFVSLQNGLGNEETIAAYADRVLGAVINQGATFLAPGDILHAGEGQTTIGPFQGTTLRDAQALAAAFESVGLPARAVADVAPDIWSKVVLNAAANPVTGLLRKKTGELLNDTHLEEAMRLVIEECVTIAAAHGVTLEPETIESTIRTVAQATRDNKSSMFQDLERGRRTEIDAINGALVDKAEAAGLDAPLNRLLTSLIHASEPQA